MIEAALNFFFSSRRRHTRFDCDWSSDVCSSDLMTVCNMSIEAGARAGMIAPDETTYRYLEGRPRAPRGEAWERALEAWRALPTDALARFDREGGLDAAAVEPMITYGTNPGMGIPIGGGGPPSAPRAPPYPARPPHWGPPPAAGPGAA